MRPWYKPASHIQLLRTAALATHTTALTALPRPLQVDGLASLGIAVEKSLEVTEASDLDEAAVTARTTHELQRIARDFETEPEPEPEEAP